MFVFKWCGFLGCYIKVMDSDSDTLLRIDERYPGAAAHSDTCAHKYGK